MDTVYDRIKYLCEKHNTTVAALEFTLGLSKSSIKKWNGSSSPSADSLLKIANHFSVSMDFLTGRTKIEESADDLMGDTDFVSLKRAMMSIPPESGHESVPEHSGHCFSVSGPGGDQYVSELQVSILPALRRIESLHDHGCHPSVRKQIRMYAI